jgi:hypothetical protein
MNCTKCGHNSWTIALRTPIQYNIYPVAVEATVCITAGCREWYLTKPQLAEMVRKINDQDKHEARESAKRPS